MARMDYLGEQTRGLTREAAASRVGAELPRTPDPRYAPEGHTHSEYAGKAVDEVIVGGAGKVWTFEAVSLFVTGGGSLVVDSGGSVVAPLVRLATDHVGIELAATAIDDTVGEWRIRGSGAQLLVEKTAAHTAEGSYIVLDDRVSVSGRLTAADSLWITGGDGLLRMPSDTAGRVLIAAADSTTLEKARLGLVARTSGPLSYAMHGQLIVDSDASGAYGLSLETASDGAGRSISGYLGGLYFFGGLQSGDTATGVYGALYDATCNGTVSQAVTGLHARASGGGSAPWGYRALYAECLHPSYDASLARAIETYVDIGGASQAAAIIAGSPQDVFGIASCDDWASILVRDPAEQTGSGALWSVADAVRLEASTCADPGRGNIRFVGGGWHDGHLQLESSHAWTDKTANVIRFAGAAPASETDGFSHFSALTAVSAGAAATLGTIGGGPSGGAQSGWLKVWTPSGARWVPAWT